MVYFDVILFAVNFFRTVLIIVVAYYLIRFISRVVMPMFSNQPNSNNNYQRQNKRNEGDVTIENNRQQGGKIPRDEGEYVDFEEID